jgi:exopolyphosphatase/guanosine-5'-triphosphate,3'-diphosphate pyrophosphatase
MPQDYTKPIEDAAVIDVGSNSVRLVLYRVEGRAIWPVFNEKVLAGLGRNLARTGQLDPQGIEVALLALKRFKALLDMHRPARIYAVATAAARDAKDGAAFVARAAFETGIQLKIISGEEEARLSALGVIAGDPDADGITADLGGASLELIEVANGRAYTGVTLPLGPFALMGSNGFDEKTVNSKIKAALDRLPVTPKARALYAVGGAWRNLGLIEMAAKHYPLHVVHQYIMRRDAAEDLTRLVIKQSRASLEKIPGLSKKRFETLPYAAAVLGHLIDRLGVEEIHLSAYGLREGLIFDGMARELQTADPLIAATEAMGNRSGSSDGLGAALQDWLRPSFDRLEPVFKPQRERIVRGAACRLADLGARLHPDHRASIVFEQVLRAPFAGIQHAERAFMALALFHRHSTNGTPPEADVLERLLSPDQRARARALGFAIRLGCDLSGRSAKLLAESALTAHNGVLTLSANAPWADILLGEAATKRLGTLADSLGLQANVAERVRA